MIGGDVQLASTAPFNYRDKEPRRERRGRRTSTPVQCRRDDAADDDGGGGACLMLSLAHFRGAGEAAGVQGAADQQRHATGAAGKTR